MRFLVLTMTILASSGAIAADDTCTSLIAALPKLSGGTALKAASTGLTYKQLYDTCDTTDTFAGQPLPKHPQRPNQRLKCSTDKNRVAFVLKYPDGTIAFSAKAAVDADGSKLACGTGWPNQCGTWLQFDRGSQRKDVNAEDTPFVVVPTKTPYMNIAFQRDAGIKQGDLAVAVSGGKCSFGVVGDAGPYFRLGELSLRSQADLDNPQCVVKDQYPCEAIHHGSGRGITSGVHYIIFPGSRPRELFSQNVNEKARTQGEAKVKAFMEKYGR